MDSKVHNPTSYLPFTTPNDEEEEDHHTHPQNLSRLSMCTSIGNEDSNPPSAYDGSDDDNGDSDEDDEVSLASSDSDKERDSHISLWRAETQPISISNVNANNEKEARRQRRLGQRKSFPAYSQRRSFGKENGENKDESEYTVMTKPKGGRRSLCMDLDEVKACRDLGFELELPSRLAISCSCSAVEANDNTSSGGNSPINSWRISSPGDDPKDVKARLKVWAQAVALASSAANF